MIHVNIDIKDACRQIREDYTQVMRKAKKVHIGTVAKQNEVQRLVNMAQMTNEMQVTKPHTFKTLNNNTWRYRLVVIPYKSLGRAIPSMQIYCFISTWRGQDIIEPCLRSFGKKQVCGVVWYKSHFFTQWNERFHTKMTSVEIVDKMTEDFNAPKWHILDSERNGHKEFIIYIRDCMGYGEVIKDDDFFIMQVNTVIPTDQMNYYKKMVSKDLRDFGDKYDNDRLRFEIEQMRVKRKIGILSDEELAEEEKKQLTVREHDIQVQRL